MTYHELFGFMSPDLAKSILEWAFTQEKPMYRATLAAVANAKKLRPAFYEKKARTERDADMLGMLSRPRLEEAGAHLMRTWLIRTQTPLLVDFLNALGVPHEDGVVEEFPPALDDAKLNAAVEGVLAKYPREHVIIYLHAFAGMNEGGWPNVNALLEKDTRLQLA